MERILIVRLGAMGDVIHALPAVAALRAGLPGARIGWVIEERWVGLLSAPNAREGPGGTPQKPLVDILHLVDTKAWRAAPLSDETWSEMRAAFAGLRAARYDAVIDFQGLIKSAAVARLSGAPTRLGFAHPKERVASIAYTRTIEPTATHIVEQNLQLAFSLAVPKPVVDGNIEIHALLPRDPAAEAWCTAELTRRGIGDFILISPGAGWGAKLWPAERYGEVARALTSVTALVNVGPGEDELARRVVATSGGRAQAIPCSLGELIELTRRARLCVGGDSGPLHLAAILDTPSVVIFGPTDPARNGPFSGVAMVLRNPSSRTSYSHTESPEEGLLGITAEQVIALARPWVGNYA